LHHEARGMNLRSDSREEQARAALLAKRRRLAHVAAALLLLALLLILVMGAIQTLESDRCAAQGHHLSTHC
jgi:hypothetical protein